MKKRRTYLATEETGEKTTVKKPRINRSRGSRGAAVMVFFTDDRGVCCTRRGRGDESVVGGVKGDTTPPLVGFLCPSAAVAARGRRGRYSGAAGWRKGWGTVAFGLALGVLLLGAEPAAAVTKPYKPRDEVAVIANNVS